jgi:hypothetical protein
MAIYANPYVSYGMWEPQWLGIELLVAGAMIWIMAGWRGEKGLAPKAG